MKTCAVFVILTCAWAASTSAEIIVDQENFGACCFGTSLEFPDEFLIQTFTLGFNGKLVGVDVRVSTSGYSNYLPVTDDLQVSLMRTNSLGIPLVDNIIAARTIPRFSFPRWSENVPMTELDFTDWNIDVRIGEKLAVALSTNHTYSQYPHNYRHYVWHSSTQNPYSGGEYYAYSPMLYGATPYLVSDRYDPPRNTRDMGFRTRVDAVPEPNTLLVSMMSGAGLLTIRRLNYSRNARRCLLSCGRAAA